MWGAFIFLAFFLVIAPSSRDAILAMVEQARLQVAVEAPLSYFLLIVLGGSALVSALIMKFWPRAEENRTAVRVVRLYRGQAEVDFTPASRSRSFGWFAAVELTWLRFRNTLDRIPSAARVPVRAKTRSQNFSR